MPRRLRMLEAVDAYGTPIAFTHNGKSKFKTACGGLLTILSVLCVAGFIYVMIDDPMKLKKITDTNVVTTDTTNTTTQTVVVANNTDNDGGTTPPAETIEWITTTETVMTSSYDDLVNVQYPTKHNLTEAGFGIAFYPSFNIQDQYGFTGGTLLTKVDGEAGTGGGIGTTNCSPATFPVQVGARAFHFSIPGSRCFNRNPLIIQGDYKSNEYIIPEFVYVKCLSGTCATNQEIIDYHKNTFLYIHVNQGYFDESDTSNPIKEYIEVVDSLAIDGSTYHTKNIRVRHNEVVFLNGTRTSFYDIENVYDSISTDAPDLPVVLAKVSLFMHPEKRTFTQVERITPDLSSARNLNTTTTTNTTNEQVVTNQNKSSEEELNKDKYYYILTLLSQVGGFCYLVKLVFGTLASMFIENVKSAYLINVIKEIRQTKNQQPDIEFNNIGPESMPFNQKNKDAKNNPQNNTSYQQMKAEIEDKMNESRDHIIAQPEKAADLNHMKSQNNQIQRSRLSKVKNIAKYSFTDVVSKSICCFCCKRKKKPTELQHLSVAEKLLYKEMDIVRILNEIKELREMNEKIIKTFLSPPANQGLLEDSKLEAHLAKTPIAPFSSSRVKEAIPSSHEGSKTKAKVVKLNSEAKKQGLEDLSGSLECSRYPEKDRKLNESKQSNQREVEQMAVHSIYNIVDKEIASLKDKSMEEHKQQPEFPPKWP
ncbi:unnamed protein product [Moneuplotes crassus]|uniref:Transmembrane protein n=1 Tax=Euplotes crassus TaxID=5936 RepID=A0AAD1Y8J7_EUPCR|nr:unnamed protein product [Moneuplotes crassus]